MKHQEEQLGVTFCISTYQLILLLFNSLPAYMFLKRNQNIFPQKLNGAEFPVLHTVWTRLHISNLLTFLLPAPQFLCSGAYLCENTAAYYKLINYSVEVLKTRLAKWLPINKTLWNQITLAIILLLSQFLKTGMNQCSICFPTELNRKTNEKKQL